MWGGHQFHLVEDPFFLAKFTPGVVVFPPGGGAINVPIGVLPFASWNTQGLPNAPICPQPISATLNLTLTCIPSGQVIGPLAFPVLTPTAPGFQPLGAPVNFVISSRYVWCESSSSILFSEAGLILLCFRMRWCYHFIGDTEVCIVPPTSLNDTIPELEMRYLSPDDEFYQTCRRGDQSEFYFLLAK